MTGSARGGAGRGFTLVELLLSVAVVLLLVAAVVFSFSTLLTGSQLDEGLAHFEQLVRLARAHSANTGRQVHMTFHEEVTPEGSVVGTIKLAWEPDPIGTPGVLEPVWTLSDVARRVNEMVAIDRSQLTGDSYNAANHADRYSEAGNSFAEAPPWLAPIRFYPDGASDSAEVFLVSRDPEDHRKAVARLEGITGGLQLDTIAPAEGGAPDKIPAAGEAR